LATEFPYQRYNYPLEFPVKILSSNFIIAPIALHLLFLPKIPLLEERFFPF